MKAAGVSVLKIIEKIGLNIIDKSININNKLVKSKNVNTAGLCLAGFLEDFEPESIYVLGPKEINYLKRMNIDVRIKMLDRFFSLKPAMIVITDKENKIPEIEIVAKKNFICCTQTQEQMAVVMLKIMKFLNAELAQSVSLHGELLVIYGEGVLITGPSKIGKSETAVELINRGHHLVADDVIEVKKVSDQKLVGAAPESIKNFIELRGVGIIDAEKMFGMDAVKISSQIDFAIELIDYGSQDFYSTNFSNKENIEILGIKIPLTRIPVKIGRNIATLVEVATMAEKQKKSGYDATKTLLKNIKKYWR
ncbi:MAG: HPr(Ser) kinase/phosphatase [Oscillospiraceae bacterium]